MPKLGLSPDFFISLNGTSWSWSSRGSSLVIFCWAPHTPESTSCHVFFNEFCPRNYHSSWFSMTSKYLLNEWMSGWMKCPFLSIPHGYLPSSSPITSYRDYHSNLSTGCPASGLSALIHPAAASKHLVLSWHLRDTLPWLRTFGHSSLATRHHSKSWP